MKASTADSLKAEATRALLTCRCGHPQIDHLHSIRDGMVVGRWLECMTQGCMCKAFLSRLTAREKCQLDTILDAKVAAGQLAAVLQHQQPASNVTIPVLRYPASRSPKRDRKSRRDKERVRSAANAGISGLYRGTGTKKPNGKYAWEEL